MFGLTPFETIQVVAWIITGTAAIVTPVVAVKWLTADFRDFKIAVKRDIDSLREDLKAHVQGLHNRIDRHEAKYDSEILRIDSRISETRERVAAIRG